MALVNMAPRCSWYHTDSLETTKQFMQKYSVHDGETPAFVHFLMTRDVLGIAVIYTGGN